MRSVRSLLLACLPAAVGGWVFSSLHLPAAWLTGGILASAVGAISLPPTRLPKPATDVAIVLLGVSVGTTATPDMLVGVSRWPASLGLLLICIYAMVFASYGVLRALYGWKGACAFWASAPGALTASLAASADTGADVQKVASAHLIRILAVSLVLPFGITGASGMASPLASPTIIPADLAILILAATGGAVMFRRFRVPGGLLLGAFFPVALLNGSGSFRSGVPELMPALACIVFATFIGRQFAGMKLADLAPLFKASCASFLAAFAISAAGAVIAAHVLGLPFAEALVAYAPGGLDVLILMSYLMKVDPAFVSAHHFVRLLFLTATLPLLGRLLFASHRRA